MRSTTLRNTNRHSTAHGNSRRAPAPAPWALALATAWAAVNVGCRSGQPPTAPGRVAGNESSADTAPHRLSSDVTPRSSHIFLKLDPAQTGFEGRVRIAIEVSNPTQTVRLHGRGLSVTEAIARQGNTSLEATVSAAQGADPRSEPDVLELRFESPLSGKVELQLAFEGTYRPDLRGLYRVQSGGEYYVFSQFEPMDARSAFPCFDEPSAKIPFDVEVAVPRGQRAFSNMPMTTEREEGDWVVHSFAHSPPLPTYLLAFAAGPLEVLESEDVPDVAPPTGVPVADVPVRLIAPKGRSARGKLAIEFAREHLAVLEEYFGVPHPYPKLDLVAVPEFSAGAMENAGLVTFREELLLVDENSPLDSQRRLAEVVAHELAHLWFGDLVTMTWWDDLWLNEGFATWMEFKVVDAWRPEMESGSGFLGWLGFAMREDSTRFARSIRQAVRTQTDAFRAFSGVTYAKGATVLSMSEQWVGKAVFQERIRSYLQGYAWKNATSQQLFEQLGSAEQPVGEVMDSFISKTGVPTIRFAGHCQGQALLLSLEQSPHVPMGSVPADENAQWQLPVCVRLPDETSAMAANSHCTRMEGGQATLRVPTKACPQSYVPNANQAGYYRSELSPEALASLAQVSPSQLTAREQVGAVMDAQAMLESGRLAMPGYLQFVADMARDKRPRAFWDAVLDHLTLVDGALVKPQTRAAFSAFVGRLLAPELARLGSRPRPPEPPADALLRGRLLNAAGLLARDPATLAEATALARQWLQDPSQVDGESAHTALAVAASLNDSALTGSLWHVAQTTEVAEHRTLALQALASLTDARLIRSLLDPIALRGPSPHERTHLLLPLLRSPRSKPIAYAWFVEHFDKLVDAIPLFRLRGFATAAMTDCSLPAHEQAAGFFRPRLEALEGMDGAIEESLEYTQRCQAYKQHHQATLARFLDRAGSARHAAPAASPARMARRSRE